MLGQKLLMWKGLRSQWEFLILDVSTAFLHAPVPAGVHMYIKPPETENIIAGEPGELEYLL
jgi:hypothetical protein